MATREGRGAISATVFALQTALIGFFACAALTLVATYSVAPTIYVDTVPLDGDTLARHPPGVTFFVGIILAVIAVLIVGVARRWRWTFWLALIACASSVLHLPVTLLQLASVLPGGPPPWYGAVQVGAEAIQIAIAAGMVHMHRRGGVWGADAQKRGSVTRGASGGRPSRRRR